MLERFLTPLIQEALADTPVVLLLGARQVGKSTLAKALLSLRPGGRYLTFDDSAVLRAAEADPVGFAASVGDFAILDEIQLAPDLFRPIKAEVDRDRRPGRFLLTGSANVMVLPRLSESLAGRMEVVTLEGLSQGEVHGGTGNFVDHLFGGSDPGFQRVELERRSLVAAMAAGGFPEAIGRAPGRRRDQWFESYLDTLIHRDVRNLSEIEGATQLYRILALMAVRSGSLLNLSELARTLALPLNTLKRYLGLLEAVYLLTTLPAWSSHLGKRLVKAPKLLFRDTGLMAHLLGVDVDHLVREPDLLGGLLETFVAGELRKALGWSRTRAKLFHYRTLPGQEVDLLLERADGQVAGIEVKASASVQAKGFKGLKGLQATLGEAFHRGVVLYTGTEVLPFGPNLWAMPVAALWRTPRG